MPMLDGGRVRARDLQRARPGLVGTRVWSQPRRGPRGEGPPGREFSLPRGDPQAGRRPGGRAPGADGGHAAPGDRAHRHEPQQQPLPPHLHPHRDAERPGDRGHTAWAPAHCRPRRERAPQALHGLRVALPAAAAQRRRRQRQPDAPGPTPGGRRDQQVVVAARLGHPAPHGHQQLAAPCALSGLHAHAVVGRELRGQLKDLPHHHVLSPGCRPGGDEMLLGVWQARQAREKQG
mmetsp:Transcript_123467/g.384294  ORF Transcript_123467/g.384294 Transcript_123467/m.384294 type:complete len:234 (-) Transcript_123467:1654-2355(-)